jgi:hypothetical protein
VPCGDGNHYVCASRLVPNGMRERSMGKGASLGEEAVLADSGREGEVAAGVGRVRRKTFSASWFYTSSSPALRIFFHEIVPRKVSNSFAVPGNVVFTSRRMG